MSFSEKCSKMINRLLLLLVLVGLCFVNGFVFNLDPLGTANPDTSSETQYLHLLLADEKAERMRLQNDFDQFKATMQQEVAKLREQLELGTSGIQTCKYVAFRTQLSHDLGAVHAGHVIVYNSVELNIGNALNPRHGIFTAPCNGTFLFSITLGNVNKGGVLHLKKNNQTIEYVFAGFNAGWDMGGASTVARLTKGDDVWVEGRGYIGGGIGNDEIGAMLHTGFSGTLIHAL